MICPHVNNDEDLAEGLVPSDAPLNTYTKLTDTNQSEVDNLDSLKAAHTLLHSELALWKGTLKEVKRLLSVNKKNFHKTNKRANPGASAGSTDVDLTDVNEWVLSSSPRAPAERVRDPLHSTNPYDRLAALWAEQPVGQTHPFNTTIDRSSLTKPKGGESKEVLCKTTATIIFYKLPTDTALCLRYINALDFLPSACHTPAGYQTQREPCGRGTDPSRHHTHDNLHLATPRTESGLLQT